MSSSLTRKYPYPSDVHVEDFVLVKLSEYNHSIWKPMILNLVTRYGLMGFLDGTTPAPEKKITVTDANGEEMEIDNPDYREWEESEQLVRRWLLQTLDSDILAQFAHKETAEKLWESLKAGLSPHKVTKAIASHEAITGQNLWKYMPLNRAVLEGDWPKAEGFLKQEPEALKAFITSTSETILFVAVGAARRNHIVKMLLDMMLLEDVIVQDAFGDTALHRAATAGNTEAAKLLVKKNSILPGIFNKSLFLPVHVAAGCGYRETVVYLLTVTRADSETKPFESESAGLLMSRLIAGGLYDIALSFLQQYPRLAQEDRSPLFAVTLRPSAFLSGTRFSSWEHFIYSHVPITDLKEEDENSAGCFISARQKWDTLFWRVALAVVPQMKQIQEKKLKHHHALQLVKYICLEIAKMDPEQASQRFAQSLFQAATSGTREVAEEILASFPSVIYSKMPLGRSFLQTAVVHRQEKVFNLIYQSEGLQHKHLSQLDVSGNNTMHLVAYMDSEHLLGSPQSPQKLYLRSTAAGGALQMQRELQWLKETETLSLPIDKESRNSTGKKAEMIFMETHEELAKEGEQWMKDRANSCIIVATLVATIVFAAAITVPGGNNNDTGLPTFAKQPAFLVFAVSDTLALFTSTISMLTFLSILTSRYAIEDFTFSLPKRLIIGLLTLFLSMLFMMIAFSSTLYLVFGDHKVWVLALVSALAGIPVMLFASLQFRPLLEIIRSTYGTGIFRKQSGRTLF